MKSGIILHLVLSLLLLFSSNPTLTEAGTIYFTGINSQTGLPVFPDSIHIYNLTLNRDTTLIGIDSFNLELFTTIDIPMGLLAQELNLSSNYPNAFTDHTDFEIQLSGCGLVHIRLYNLLGEKQFDYMENMNNGRHGFRLISGNLCPGIYILSVSSLSEQQSRKIIKIGSRETGAPGLQKLSLGQNQISLNRQALPSTDNVYHFVGYARHYYPDSLSQITPQPGLSYQFIFQEIKESPSLLVTSKTTGHAVNFNYMAFDPDSNLHSLEIDFENDNQIDQTLVLTGSSAVGEIVHHYPGGAFTALFKLLDTDSLTDQKEISLTIEYTPPQIQQFTVSSFSGLINDTLWFTLQLQDADGDLNIARFDGDGDGIWDDSLVIDGDSAQWICAFHYLCKGSFVPELQVQDMRGLTTQSKFSHSIVIQSPYQVYFGDLHVHTAYSNDAWKIQKLVLKKTPEEPEGAIISAKTRPLDFVAITDHAEQIDVENLIYGRYGQEWVNLQTQCNQGNSAEIVAFIGFEYTKTSAKLNPDSSLSPIPGGGHKCVIFKSDVVPASPYGSTETNSPIDLWNYLQGYECITIPHHPARGDAPQAGENWDEYDMSTDWSYFPPIPDIQPLVEIFSVHGSSEDTMYEDQVAGFRAEKSVESALSLWLKTGNPAYKLGIVGSTDDHTSRPGNCLVETQDAIMVEEGDYSGGLAAALATAKSRDGIFAALQSRKTYGTSGPKINLDFTIVVRSAPARTYFMGETISGRSGEIPVELRIDSEGATASIEKTEIIVVDSLGKTQTFYYQATLTLNLILSRRSYIRVTAYQSPTQRWDPQSSSWVITQERAWSSPIWFEPH